MQGRGARITRLPILCHLHHQKAPLRVEYTPWRASKALNPCPCIPALPDNISDNSLIGEKYNQAAGGTDSVFPAWHHLQPRPVGSELCACTYSASSKLMPAVLSETVAVTACGVFSFPCSLAKQLDACPLKHASSSARFPHPNNVSIDSST